MKYLFFFMMLLQQLAFASESFMLKDNLQKASPGDYIVTAQGKNYTVLHILDKQSNTLSIEEISIHAANIPKSSLSWRNWVETGAPGNSSWVFYTIDLNSGHIREYRYLSDMNEGEFLQRECFLTTLLNLRLTKVAVSDRKRYGVHLFANRDDLSKVWQPKMVVEGKKIDGVLFDAWRTIWPQDSSELAGKTIEIFTPQESSLYPSYFPYWMEVIGLVGKAKVRIVDSGSNLKTSP